MRTVLFSFIFILLTGVIQAAEVEVLSAAEWAQPKTAANLTGIPAIKLTMQKLIKQQDSMLQLRYPGGDEGTLWANELRSWLVALGLSSARIELVPGSSTRSAIELEVME